jgi:hypothetical protein
MKTFARVGFILFGLIALFWVWYWIAANYDYRALAGTCAIDRQGEICTLRLKADGTFFEVLKRPDSVHSASGTWHRFGEASVEFSPSFLMLSGQERNSEGGVYGHFEKTLTLFPFLSLESFVGINRWPPPQTPELVGEVRVQNNRKLTHFLAFHKIEAGLCGVLCRLFRPPSAV